MKRLILIITLLLIMISLTACVKKKEVDNSKVKITKEKKSKKVNEVNSNVDLIGKGQVSNIEFKIGSAVKDIEKKLGTNYEDKIEYQGVFFVSYAALEYTFIYSFDEKLWGIYLYKGHEIFGVTIGDTAEQIKKVLGNPTKEYYSNPDKNQDQLEFQQTQSFDEYILEYSKGNYTLEFIFESKNSSSVFAIYHLKK